MPRVAALQMASGPNLQANLLEADRLLAVARESGAVLAVLPENFAFMGLKEADKLDVAEADGDGPIQRALSRAAAREGLWIVGGTIPLRTEVPGKVAPACLVFDSNGRRVARFDKIHLFDVDIDDSQERYRESATLHPGGEVVVLDTPVGRMGLAVCYDLRFPELFRQAAEQGAQVFAVPAAFTQVTGRAHWEILTRARAIENLAYLVAAAQGGYHVNGRETYGHSMIIDPWGTVLDRLPRGSGVVCAEVSAEHVDALRRRFPALSHRRLG
ncbi:MAG: carbon-nitrogen hydrolase family protein [Pseudomonadota bacterium]|nr:carbon-nitrogen hydrolase family protein [Pseudomonadota bacterium]